MLTETNTNTNINTMDISGKVNRTAERYLEILRYHGLELCNAERDCLKQVCGIGFLSPDDVRFSVFEDPRIDKEGLATRLEAASFADLVATVEALGC
jgi:hypothetical protein